MAADSSIDETDAAPPVPIDERPSPLRETSGGPPRPPRPVKRASGSVRIPLPSAVAAGSKLNGSARADVAAAPATPVPTAPGASMSDADAALSSPAVATPVPTARFASTRPPAAVVTPEVPGDPAANIEFQLTRRSSAAPPLTFDSADVDPSDRAPGAPFTPWRDVPRAREPSVLESLPAPSPKEDLDREDTMVGAVPKDLLDLSIENEEENTRAYQAPQELIDLARRQREERLQAQAGSGKRKRDAKAAFHESLPPTARRAAEDDDQSDINTATVPVATVPAGDAAPPVELSRPARAEGGVAPGAGKGGRSGAPSLSELAREISERHMPGSLAPASDVVRGAGGSESAPPAYRTPWLTRGRIWGLLVGLFIAVGYALARWRGLDLLR